MMDSDYPVDVDEILRVLSTAEVVVVRFLILPQRLLVDPRTTATDGPLVALVPPARSAEERFRSLRQLRPRFSPPERITVIHWPKFIDRLEGSGVWAGIEKRVLAAGFPETASMVTDALCELRRLERAEIHKAVRGDGYQTLWERGAGT